MKKINNLENKTFLIIDGSSYLYRAYYAMPSNFYSPNGKPSGALYGFINMIRSIQNRVKAKYGVFVFDSKGKTCRNKWYPDYKKNRPVMPELLIKQINPIYIMLQSLGWSVLVVDGVEADDVIGTLTLKALNNNMHIIIASNDKDFAQLVRDRVSIITSSNKKILNIKDILYKFGVLPEQIVDYLCLIGDASDNIPGVKKCGPKSAIKLINKYNTLDKIIIHSNEIVGILGKNLRNSINFLPLAKKLITIQVNCNLEKYMKSIEETFFIKPIFRDKLCDLYIDYGFKKWLYEII